MAGLKSGVRIAGLESSQTRVRNKYHKRASKGGLGGPGVRVAVAQVDTNGSCPCWSFRNKLSANRMSFCYRHESYQ